MLEGAHPLAGLTLASGTNAVFYAIVNCCQAGDHLSLLPSQRALVCALTPLTALRYGYQGTTSCRLATSMEAPSPSSMTFCHSLGSSAGQ